MVFQDAYITDAGAELLARSAGGEGSIVWGEARTSSLDTDDYTADEMAAITTATFGTTTSDGLVTNTIVDVGGGSVTLHCELSNETYNGTARTFGVWAQVEGDGVDVLAVVARSGDGATPTDINPAAVCQIKLFVDFTIDISDHQANAVAVTEGYYATASALQTVEDKVEHRAHAYRDLWEAMEKSQDGEWFSLTGTVPRKVRITDFGFTDLTGASERNITVLQYVGPWMLCRATVGNRKVCDELTVGISHVSEFLGPNAEIHMDPVILSWDSNDRDSIWKLLWAYEEGNDWNFLYEKDGVLAWSLGDSFTHSGYFHRTSAGLVRVSLDGASINFDVVESITPTTITLGERFATISNANGRYSNGSEYFSSIMLTGKRIALYKDVTTYEWMSCIGEQEDINNYGLGNGITNVENGIVTISSYVNLNGTQYGDILAFDCCSKFSSSDSNNTFTMFRNVNGLTIPWDMGSFIQDMDDANDLYEANEGVYEAFFVQPCGIFSCTISGDGSYIMPWPGCYCRMVNRNGILLPYVDNPPEYVAT